METQPENGTASIASVTGQRPASMRFTPKGSQTEIKLDNSIGLLDPGKRPSLSIALTHLKNREHVGFAYDNLKIAKWFVLTNAAIVLSIVIVTGGQVAIALIFAVLGAIVPFVMLALSKPIAKWTHDLRMITEVTAANSEERALFALVTSLSKRAGLPETPEIGIYDSADMNAFATGMNKSHSLVAFSSALLEKMDGNSVAAVAAHEVSHIANGDMVTMSLVQSAVNAIILTLRFPLDLYRFFARHVLDDGHSVWIGIIIDIAYFVIVTVLLFLGNLVVKAFSRHREFAADRGASLLTSSVHMNNALKTLEGQEISFPAEQKGYAAFKISSPAAFCDILSTHPSTERRIAALVQLGEAPIIALSKTTASVSQPLPHKQKSLGDTAGLVSEKPVMAVPPPVPVAYVPPLVPPPAVPPPLPVACDLKSPPDLPLAVKPLANNDDLRLAALPGMRPCRCGKTIHESAVACPRCGATQVAAPATDKKAETTYSLYDQVPWYRKNWFAICLAVCFILGIPVLGLLSIITLLVMLFTGNFYYQQKGQVKGYSKLAKIVCIIGLLYNLFCIFD